MSQSQNLPDPAARILDQAQQLFMRYGVRSITLDEIAKELGISKKTIYQHYKNKADIVLEVSKAYMEKSEGENEEICRQSKNAIHELVQYMKWLVKEFKSMSPNLILEIQRYYPASWQVFQEHESRFILGKIKDNLVRGIEEGLYRKDLNVELVARIRVAQIDHGFDETLFPISKFSPLEVQSQMLELYMQSIVSEKGRKMIEDYVSKELNMIRQFT